MRCNSRKACKSQQEQLHSESPLESDEEDLSDHCLPLNFRVRVIYMLEQKLNSQSKKSFRGIMFCMGRMVLFTALYALLASWRACRKILINRQ